MDCERQEQLILFFNGAQAYFFQISGPAHTVGWGGTQIRQVLISRQRRSRISNFDGLWERSEPRGFLTPNSRLVFVFRDEDAVAELLMKIELAMSTAQVSAWCFPASLYMPYE